MNKPQPIQEKISNVANINLLRLSQIKVLHLLRIFIKGRKEVHKA